jgi:hypothetical protein
MSIIESPRLSNRKARDVTITNPRSLSGQVSTPTHHGLDTQNCPGVRGLDSLNDHYDIDVHTRDVVEGQISTIDHNSHDTHVPFVDGGTDFNPDHGSHVTQVTGVGVEPLSTPTQQRNDTHKGLGGRGPFLYDPTLEMAANIVDDMERVRIANENRLRQLTRDTEDDDGETRGLGLPIDHPDVARLAGIVEGLTQLEDDAIKNLQKVVRRHPLWTSFLKAQKGVGEKQAGRLLAAIGDPYWHIPYDRPRTVSELWAYCGYHVLPGTHITLDTHVTHGAGIQTSTSSNTHPRADNHVSYGVAARRTRGQKVNWNPDAKMRAYLIGAQCQRYLDSPYRIVTDQRRAHTAITHPEWTPGHSLNDGIRVATKTFLKDLWIASRDIHEGA